MSQELHLLKPSCLLSKHGRCRQLLVASATTKATPSCRRSQRSILAESRLVLGSWHRSERKANLRVMFRLLKILNFQQRKKLHDVRL